MSNNDMFFDDTTLPEELPFIEETMDDRESVYLDTISYMSDSYSTHNNNYRKSINLSRQTLYHSTMDLQENCDSRDGVMENGDVHTHHVPKMTTNNEQNGNYLEMDDINAPYNKNEVSTLLISKNSYISPSTSHNPSMTMGNAMKSTVTYLQWKNRAWRRFQDGHTPVDYILAYDTKTDTPEAAKKREYFEKNLESEGLILETEKTQRIHFIKISAPKEVLARYCELIKMKMPLRELRGQESVVNDEFHLMQEVKSFFGKPFSFVKLDPSMFPKRKYELQHEYSRDKSYLFDTDREDFFNQSIRIAVVHFILERQRFTADHDNANCIGITKLLNDNVYRAAYPLHDGNPSTGDGDRSLLYKEWAAVRKWIHHQPLDTIKDYFGVQIALYFAWLGFYTHMLIPAAVAGLICFLFGLFTLFSNQISNDICNDNSTIIMCPQCDAKCDYWYLKETCVYSRISYLFDNSLTPWFAFFMAVWATLYLEMWKRYSANITHRWGMTGFSYKAEHPRPEYLARLQRAKRSKLNVVTNVLEPSVPYWKKKFPIYLLSYSVVLLFICLAIAAVFGVVIYRMSTMTSKNLYGNTDTMSYKILVTPAAAAVLNLVVITILNYIYSYLAAYLTNLEFLRSQTEYDESLTLKIYLFQFVNYYSSIFYIAFVKGKFVGYPAKYNRIFGFRQEECSPGGCLMELCVQLAIIMIGKQAINSVMEMLVPFLWKKFNTFIHKIGLSSPSSSEDGSARNAEGIVTCNQWTEDFKLSPWSSMGLFEEYLEMIIQYGFVTIFVVAFPLAPLFALINNVFEMRLDAKKFLAFYRRSVPKRVRDIGVWYNIMHILGKISVVSSAFIISFSSNFIPRLVYMYVNAINNHSEKGYLNSTLAYFNTQDFQPGTAPLNTTFGNVDICRYPEYRNPPWEERKYKRPLIYWQILAMRLLFIVLFQNMVGSVQLLVGWAIPDVPRSLSDQIKREEYLTSEIIIAQEKMRVDPNASTVFDKSTVDLDAINVSEENENEFRSRKNRNGVENTIL